MIRVENLRVRARGEEILKGITFEVAPRTVLGIMGASGSGKTTLLRCLNGLERIDAGAIECDDVRLAADLSEKEYERAVKRLRRVVGMVFQHLHLFPHLTVLANITEAPHHVLRQPRSEAEKHALSLLDSVGLARAAERYPESLSGGEQQRVAIVRALAMRPDVLLFDEPTSALDPRRSSELRAVLRNFVERGHTMIVVSHSIQFLASLSDHLLYMESGEIVEQGTTAQMMTEPRDERTREFLRQAE